MSVRPLLGYWSQGQIRNPYASPNQIQNWKCLEQRFPTLYLGLGRRCRHSGGGVLTSWRGSRWPLPSSGRPALPAGSALHAQNEAYYFISLQRGLWASQNLAEASANPPYWGQKPWLPTGLCLLWRYQAPIPGSPLKREWPRNVSQWRLRAPGWEAQVESKAAGAGGMCSI